MNSPTDRFLSLANSGHNFEIIEDDYGTIKINDYFNLSDLPYTDVATEQVLEFLPRKYGGKGRRYSGALALRDGWIEAERMENERPDVELGLPVCELFVDLGKVAGGR